MGALVTQVSCHPKMKIVAAGYNNGVLILIDAENGKYVPVYHKNGDIITHCEWDALGGHLIYGTKLGNYGFVKST